MLEHAWFSPGTKVECNGLLFNDPSSNWVCTQVMGLGSPAPRFDQGERIAADGSWATKAYLNSRAIELEGVHIAPNAADGDNAISELIRAATINDAQIKIHLASGPVTATVRRVSDIKFERIQPGYHRWSVAFIALDPRLFIEGGTWERTLGTPQSTGGLILPATVPWLIDAVVSNDSVTYDNQYPGGKVEYRIDGFVPNPRIYLENASGLHELRWNLTVGSGEYLTVDPETRSALLMGQSQRSPIVRGWSNLTPGPNTFRFRSDTFNAESKLTVTVRPAL